MTLILACLLAFLTGALPTAYLFGKLLKGIDIREHGSGNMGATNAGRIMGRKVGATVYAIDFFKGFLPVLAFSCSLGFPASDFRALSAIGFCAVLGHIFTPFLGFRGGKGVATGGGVLAASQPIIFLVVVAVWVLFYKISKIVSLSSLAAATAMPIISLILNNPINVHCSLVFAALIAFWSHRANIYRLWKGICV